MTLSSKLKVVTVVGTRPEIIRLAAVIRRLDVATEQVLVHTGQNYDYLLNEVFFKDLSLRAPDHYLQSDTTSLARVMGTILIGMEEVLLNEKPDALVILGDTNSSIAAVIAKRMRIPVYHLEAGNRSFDQNVPEETNRMLVDHVADYNLVYTEHARRNLLSEGIHPSRILLTGSPLKEVIAGNREAIDASSVVSDQGLKKHGYFLVSLHREENVDDSNRLGAVLNALRQVRSAYGLPILVSTHPRTRARLEEQPPESMEGLTFHAPFGLNDYIKLQLDARAVLSDSGTISEESALLGFPGISLRDAIERPEAIDTGVTITSGVNAEAVLDAIRITLEQYDHDGPAVVPADYAISDTSRRVVNFIRSTASTHHARSGLRRGPVS